MVAALMNQSGLLAVEAATRRSNRLFAIYLGVLIITGLTVAYLTWLTWDANNKVQDAIQANANARIQEANSNAAQANQTSQELRNANLKLQSDIETQKGSVAILQVDAAKAKSDQQKVEVDLAKQRTLAADAERSLAELRNSVAPRRLNSQQALELRDFLSKAPKGTVDFTYVNGDGEASALVLQLMQTLREAGWQVIGGSPHYFEGAEPVGLHLYVKSTKDPPTAAVYLQQAFFSIGFPLASGEVPDLDESSIHVVVGHKPGLIFPEKPK